VEGEQVWLIRSASAVEDALRPLGIKIDGLPIRPVLLREMIREAQQRRT
jgi:hypothetical protein